MTRQIKFTAWILFALTVIGLLIYIWSAILPPFFVAALLAYLCHPLVIKLQRRRLSRTLAVVIVFTSMLIVGLLLLIMLVPMIEHQIRVLITLIPKIFTWLRTDVVPLIQDRFGMKTIDLGAIQHIVMAHWKTAGNVAATVVKTISNSGGVIAAWFANLLLVPVVTFYLLRDWHTVIESVQTLLPRRIEPLISQLSGQCNDVLRAFFRGQLLVMLALGLIYSIGLSLVGLSVALLIGLMAGCLSIVPYLGFIVGIGAALVAAIIQFHDVTHVVYVLIVFGIGQALEGMVLTPWLVGDKIGLHPVAVIFSILAGGQMFGFIGVLLALPVAAVIMVLLRYGHSRYLESEVYTVGSKGATNK